MKSVIVPSLVFVIERLGRGDLSSDIPAETMTTSMCSVDDMFSTLGICER